eukprot:TRINITY_DN4162_c0_g2_i1.p2 TRINITY_DN4162_c0_g2~~TRINITY_DN4162_c0_g2_i1.p2  ORF type:complete len:488 (-),score=101.56 TRINITY_DN4162_c0_g2_i1:1449-2912(-)
MESVKHLLELLEGERQLDVLVQVFRLIESYVELNGGSSVLGSMGFLSSLHKVLTWTLQNWDQKDVEQIVVLTVGTIWRLSIGEVSNKKRAACCLETLLEVLKKSLAKLKESPNAEESPFKKAVQYCGMAIWSICYGIPENARKYLSLDGTPPIIEMLSLPHFHIQYAAAGVVWHVSDVPEGALQFHQSGVVDLLVGLIQSKMEKDDCIVPCFALGKMSSQIQKFYWDIPFDENKLLPINEFLKLKDPLKFQNPFVWTTVKPLIDLLECPYESVKLLGTFFAVVTVKAKQATATLFMEGAVKLLKDIAESSPDYSPLSNYSILALKELGITVEKKRSPDSIQYHDIESWLKSVNLGEYTKDFTDHKITFDSVLHLTEADLLSINIPLGPRRKLLHLIKSLNNSKNPPPNNPQSTTDRDPCPICQISGNSSCMVNNSCLICCSGVKDCCFVPCGHVATCLVCAEALISRGDKCIICRNEIIKVVKLYFV